MAKLATKKQKPPPGTPTTIGERVKFRGRAHLTGTLKVYDPETLWCRVDWDGTKIAQTGPDICHLYELALHADG